MRCLDVTPFSLRIFSPIYLSLGILFAVQIQSDGEENGCSLWYCFSFAEISQVSDEFRLSITSWLIDYTIPPNTVTLIPSTLLYKTYISSTGGGEVQELNVPKSVLGVVRNT